MGIEWKVLIAQIINFAILFYVLRRFALTPILGILKKREEKIMADKKTSEGIALKISEIERLKDEILSKARRESEQIVREGEKVAVRIKEELTAEAHKEFERIVLAGRKQLEDDRMKAEAGLKKDIGELLALAVEKTVGDAFDKHAHTELVREARAVIMSFDKVR